MSSIVVNGDTSGSVTLSAPATAGTVTVTLPSASGTMAVSGGSTSFTNLAYTGTLTGNGGIVNIGSGQVYKDASGNVGIGTSSPSERLTVESAGTYTASFNNTAQDTRIRLLRGGVEGGQISASATDLNLVGASVVKFLTNSAERARIDSSGNLLVGTTSAITSGKISVDSSTAGVTARTTGTTNNWTAFIGARNGNDGRVAEWYRDAAGSMVGNISVTASATSYNTSSDYRLKENIAPMTGALAKVALLKPVTYKWKVDGSNSQGFIAHELQAVVPECVVGEKDAVDAEGNPQYQGIDTSFLVVTLAAAIQELKAIVDAQGAEIAALKGAI